MKNILDIFQPLKKVNRQTILLLMVIEVIFALVLWQMWDGKLIPTPTKVLKSLVELVTSHEFLDNLITSLGLTIKGMFFSIIIALFFSYLSVIAFFKPLTTFLTKCRYLTLTGLIFLFTLITQNGSQLKISLLIFGIVPFFVTSLISIFNNINSQEFDLCKTLRMSNWKTLFEVIVLGRIDQVFEVMRQNFAIAWMMITMVEGLSMSEGGLGTMLIKSNKYIDMGRVFALLVVILIIGILFDYLLSKVRVWLFPYSEFQTLK